MRRPLLVPELPWAPTERPHVEHEVTAATAVAMAVGALAGTLAFALAVRTGHSARDRFSVYVGHHSLPCRHLLDRPISLPAARIIPNSNEFPACYSAARRARSWPRIGSGTRPLTSPPYLATSFTRLELRNEYSGLVVMNSVSTLARR